MTVLQLNPINMQNTAPGYISSITIRYNGANNVLTPDANNQITLPNSVVGGPEAAARILGAGGNLGVLRGTAISFVHAEV